MQSHDLINAAFNQPKRSGGWVASGGGGCQNDRVNQKNGKDNCVDRAKKFKRKKSSDRREKLDTNNIAHSADVRGKEGSRAR